MFKLSPEISAAIARADAEHISRRAVFANLDTASLLASARFWQQHCDVPRRYAPGEPVYDSTFWHVILPELMLRLEQTITPHSRGMIHEKEYTMSDTTQNKTTEVAASLDISHKNLLSTLFTKGAQLEKDILSTIARDELVAKGLAARDGIGWTYLTGFGHYVAVELGFGAAKAASTNTDLKYPPAPEKPALASGDQPPQAQPASDSIEQPHSEPAEQASDTMQEEPAEGTESANEMPDNPPAV